MKLVLLLQQQQQQVRFMVEGMAVPESLGGVVALSVEYRTRNQEVVGSSHGRARGVKTLGICLCSPSSTSWYRPKGGDALRLGSKGRYGLCVSGR